MIGCMITSAYYHLRKQLIALKLFKPNTAVYIVSYPKSGRTWLRLLIGKALCDTYAAPEQLMLDTYQLTQVAHLPRTHFTHDFSSILGGFPYQHLPTNKQSYVDKKVLFVMREIKDVLVSSYFQATKRTGKFDGPISEFIRHDVYGVRKIVTFYNSWHAAQAIPQAFLLLRYEAMHADPHHALRQTLDFMGATAVSDETIATAVQFASFSNMKKMEETGTFTDSKLRPANRQDEESFKVRRGKIGGYTDYLSPEDIQYIDETIAQMGCPFLEIAA